MISDGRKATPLTSFLQHDEGPIEQNNQVGNGLYPLQIAAELKCIAFLVLCQYN